MNMNRTEIVYIMDRSGSMYRLTNDVIGGYNTFIKEQQNEEGEAFITTILFDTVATTLCEHVNIMDAKPITTEDYTTAGMTGLMDAVGMAIDSLGKRLYNTPEDERPGKVLFMIMTDGYENASKEYSTNQIKHMIKHQKETYNWEFIFVGAGIDAVSVGNTMGLAPEMVMSVKGTAGGMSAMYASMSKAARDVRTKGSVSLDWSKPD